MNRPTFYTNNNLPIRASGILVYTKNSKGDILYLLRFSKGTWGDLGGKTELGDYNAFEETNCHLLSKTHRYEDCADYLYSKKNKKKLVKKYVGKSKYMCYIINVTKYIYYMDLRRFGKVKTYSNERHKFRWFKKIPFNINPRLRFLKKYKL
jgi:hypothetical protein